MRLGSFTRSDGAQLPLWHDSEVAAIGYAIQNIMAQRNDGAQKPADVVPPGGQAPQTMAGKKCQECGAHAVIKKDGCDYCTQCGYLGSCG